MLINKTSKVLKNIQNQELDLRESKTPRDMVPKLNAWDVVKERDMGDISSTQDEHSENNIKSYFDKEKYMKNNWINNRTKLQLDHIQSNESKIVCFLIGLSR